jgi:hypothetical protein
MWDGDDAAPRGVTAGTRRDVLFGGLANSLPGLVKVAFDVRMLLGVRGRG